MMKSTKELSLKVNPDDSTNWMSYTYSKDEFRGLFVLGWLSEFSWSVNEVLPSEVLQCPSATGVREKDGSISILFQNEPTQTVIAYYQCLALILKVNSIKHAYTLSKDYIEVWQNGEVFYLDCETEQSLKTSDSSSTFDASNKNYVIKETSLSIRDMITKVVEKSLNRKD